MFKFLNLFKKENPIPTIKATAKHKLDDKRQHKFFLTELENLLTESKLFKVQYIKKYVNLYKAYHAFTGKDHSLIMQQPYFIESLTDETQQYKKTEIKRYTKNIIAIANRRSYTKTTLKRFEEDNLFQQVTLIFPKNELICEKVITQKKVFHNKKTLITKAPILPLTSCIKCPSTHHCSLGIAYKPYIELKKQ